MDRRLLATYLNDHLAGSVAARELVRRAAGSNKGTSYGAFLKRLGREIDEDHDALLALMGSLDVGVDRAKVAAGWTAEKLGRLKPNGRLISYSPLSRVVEFEALLLGVRGKLAGWEALEELRPQEPAMAAADLPLLIKRAEKQLSQIEEHRRRAVLEALGS